MRFKKGTNGNGEIRTLFPLSYRTLISQLYQEKCNEYAIVLCSSFELKTEVIKLQKIRSRHVTAE